MQGHPFRLSKHCFAKSDHRCRFPASPGGAGASDIRVSVSRAYSGSSGQEEPSGEEKDIAIARYRNGDAPVTRKELRNGLVRQMLGDVPEWNNQPQDFADANWRA